MTTRSNKISKINSSKLTDFQKKVLLETLKIPKGTTKTYSEIAIAIGNPNSARAVGNALHKNPFAPEVPCHRVVSKNGIGGYSHGIKRKIALLKKEKWLR